MTCLDRILACTDNNQAVGLMHQAALFPCKVDLLRFVSSGVEALKCKYVSGRPACKLKVGLDVFTVQSCGIQFTPVQRQVRGFCGTFSN